MGAKGSVIILVVIMLVVAAIVVGAFVLFSGTDCDGDSDCFSKNLEKCGGFELNGLRTDNVIVQMEDQISLNIEILGERKGSKCLVSYNVVDVEDSLDEWAKGKSME